MLLVARTVCDTVDMSVSLPTDKPFEIPELALFFGDATCYSPPGHVFLGKATYCANRLEQLQKLCRVIQSDMLTIYHSPPYLFLTFYLSFPSLQ